MNDESDRSDSIIVSSSASSTDDTPKAIPAITPEPSNRLAPDEPIKKYSELFNAETEKLSCGQQAGRIAGIIDVGTAMAPQVGLGALATDYLSKGHMPDGVRYPLDAVMGGISGTGKFALVYYLSKQTFMTLGTQEGWKNLFERAKIPVNWPLFLAGLPSASVYPYINKISDDLSQTLVPTDSGIKQLLASQGFQVPTMVASAIANVLSFPWIIWEGITRIRNTINYIRTQPQYRKITDEISNDMEKIRTYYKRLGKEGRVEELDKLLYKITHEKLTDNSPYEIREGLLNLLKELEQDSTIQLEETVRESWKKYIAKIGFGLTVLGISLYGASSFPLLAAQAVIYYGSLMGITVSANAANFFGYFAYHGIIMLNLPTYDLMPNLIDYIFNYKTSLSFASHPTLVIAGVMTLIGGLTGGTSTLAQSFITGQPIVANVFSVLFSNNVEYAGLSAMMLIAIRWMIKHTKSLAHFLSKGRLGEKINPEEEFRKKLIEAADKIIQNACDLTHVSPAELRELQKIHYEIIRERENKNESEVITISSRDNSSQENIDGDDESDHTVIDMNQPDIDPLPRQYVSSAKEAWNKTLSATASCAEACYSHWFWLPVNPLNNNNLNAQNNSASCTL